MRHPRLSSTHFVAAALVIAGVLAPLAVFGQAQPPAPPTAPEQGQMPAPVIGPYKVVPIKLPPAMNDPSFEAFRKQLADIAERKDRAALARLVAPNFFWVLLDKNLADKQKSAIDNLVNALNLDAAGGWEELAGYAAETTAAQDPQRRGIVCAPGQPAFDGNAADQLLNATNSDPADWFFPIRDGIEVRSEAKQDAPVVDKLGLYLVLVLIDEVSAQEVFFKVLTPSGKVGYVLANAVRPIGDDQLCYVQESGTWKIAGFYGGETN